MTVLDDKLIIAGGMAMSGEATNNVLVLEEGAWKNFSRMPTARYWSAAARQNGLHKLRTTELLDTTNGCWYTCNDLPVPHFSSKP